MKSYIAALFAFCMGCLSVVAQSTNPATVTVYCDEGIRLYVFVDDQQQNQEPHASVELSLRPGMHYIRAQSEDGKLATAQSIVYLQPKEQLVLQFEMPFPRLARRTAAPDAPPTPAPAQPATAQPATVCLQTMSAATHNRVLTSMGEQTGDPARLIVAKQAAKYNCLTADQIAAIMRLLNFEDTRIEFAAFAHTYCIDLQRFYQVNDAFISPNSAVRLQEAIDNGKYRSTQARTEPIAACSYTLTRADFERLTTSINQQSQDDDRLVVAKQATQNACLTADQIRTVLLKIDQSAIQVKFAAYAYAHCSDPANYFVVNDALNNVAAVAELESILQLIK